MAVIQRKVPISASTCKELRNPNSHTYQKKKKMNKLKNNDFPFLEPSDRRSFRVKF